MSQAPLTEEQIKEAADAYIKHGRNGLQAAQSLDMARSTFDNRLRAAKRKGMLPDELPGSGFEIKQESVRYNADGEEIGRTVTSKPEAGEEFKVPEGYSIKGESALVGPDGRVNAKWIKTDRDAAKGEALVEAVKAAVEGAKVLPLIKAPKSTDKDLCCVIPVADAHVGLLADAEESGSDYNLKIAKKYILGNVEKLMLSTPNAKQAICVFSGDFLHSDSISGRTPGSGHVLDCDTRFAKQMKSAVEIALGIVQYALQKFSRVLVRCLIGNHDLSSANGVALSLWSCFRDNPRVTVDLSPSRFFMYEHQSCLFFATHGDQTKVTDIPHIMADYDAPAWGRTKYRAAWTGHRHSREQITVGSVEVFQLAAITPKDAWSAGRGYASQRGFSAYVYSGKHGLVSSHHRLFPSNEQVAA